MKNAERRIKRRIHGRPQSCVVRCAPGLADVALDEITAVCTRLAHPQEVPPRVRAFGGGVLVEGLDFRNLLQLPYELTTARDVLWRVHTATAGNPSALRRELGDIDWEDLLPRGVRFGVRADSTRSRVYHEGLIEEETAKAAARSGAVAVRKLDADHMIEVRLDRDTLEVLMSLAGPRLYMRGFKSALRGVATIKEDLAAICVRLAMQQAKATWSLEKLSLERILTPYAGTGTLGFEALIALHNIPLWAFPRTFSQDILPCVPQASLGFIRKRQVEAAQSDRHTTLQLIDIDAAVCSDLERDVASFKDAVKRAVNIAPSIEITVGDATAKVRALASDGQAVDTMVLMNPPYGKRLGERDDTRKTYRGIVTSLEEARTGKSRLCGALIIPDHDIANECSKALPGYATSCREMRHGGLKVWVLAFATKA